MRLAMCTMLIALPVAAQPGSTTLEMRYLRGENLHIANQNGAINWHDEATLKLELRPGGKLTGTETGRAREHNLHARNGVTQFTTEEIQSWTHRWSGTWKQAGDTLALDVVLDSRTCARTKKYGDGPLEQLACGKVSSKIHFDCKTTQVTLLSSPQNPIRRAVWQCLPASSPDLDRTPIPWTFGKTSCVRMLGGQPGPSYDRC